MESNLYFNCFSYGIPRNPTVDKPLILSGKDCEILNAEKWFKYDGQIIRVQSVQEISEDVTLKGSYRHKDGSCENGIPFSYGGIFYASNWMVARIKGKNQANLFFVYI